MKRRLLACWALLAPLSATELDFPATFRRDLATDRDFEFGHRYFLDVASFRFFDDAEARFRDAEKGYRGTGGSVSSDELYLVQEVRYRKALDDRWAFSYRFLQDEDFDGEIVKNLLFLDYGAGDFRIGPVAELDQFKEDLDLGATAAWRPSPAHAFRAWAFFTDPFFNEKTSGQDRYERRAVTWALEGCHRPSKGLLAGWSASWIPPVSLDLRGRGYVLHAAQVSCKGELDWAPAEGRMLTVRASLEETRRDRDYASPVDPLTFAQARSVDRARLGWRQGSGERAWRLGLEWIGFREHTEWLMNGASTHLLRRRELIASAGVDRRISERWTARPTAFLAKLSNRDDFALSPAAEDRNNGLESKAALAFEYRFPKGGTIVLNPTVQLDGLGFGGGNLQLEMEF